MSKVNCSNCKAVMDSRSASACKECYGYLCPRCAADSQGYCFHCHESNEDWL